MKRKILSAFALIMISFVAFGFAACGEKEVTYTVTWKNGDNVLELDEKVKEGAMPTYDGAEPTKVSTAEYEYSFTGWNPEVSKVTKDATYVAQFAATKRKYTVKYNSNYTGGVDQTRENVEYGTEIKDLPEISREEYNFLGWYTAEEGGDLVEKINVAGNVEVYAHWARKVTLKINQEIPLSAKVNEEFQVSITIVNDTEYDYEGPVFFNTRTYNEDRHLTFKNFNVVGQPDIDVREAINKNRAGEVVYGAEFDEETDNFLGYHIYNIRIPKNSSITITATGIATKAVNVGIMTLTLDSESAGFEIKILA